MRPIKEYEYIVVMKKKSTKTIDIISLLMLMLAISFFIFELAVNAINNNLDNKSVLLFIWIIGIVGWLFMCYKQYKAGVVFYFRFALMIAGWGWFMHPKAIWLSLVYLLAAIFEKPVKVQPEYALDAEGITYNSFPQKKYTWQQLNNGVIKDGLLTIDCKNNKLIQQEINEEISVTLESEFNEYCREQLVKI
jgi:hypothetical protein